MAKTTSLIGKALKGLKAAAAVGRATEPSGASEKIVAIPEIAVFSELPFAHVGVIGGAEVNIVTNPSATTRKSAKKSASKTKSASSKAGKTAKKTTKKSAVKKSSKRKKAR